MLGLRCCLRAFSSCGKQGLLFVVVHGPITAVASPAAEHGPQQLWHLGPIVVARGLQSTGSVVVAHEFGCSMACGIFPDQGSNPLSPALAGRLPTTAPPGERRCAFLIAILHPQKSCIFNMR